MLDASPPAAPSSSHYLHEVEQLTGVPFFADQERACALRNSPEKLSPQDIAERKLLYTAGLRLLAERRRYGERDNFQDRARFIGQQLLLINNAEEYGSEAPAHFRPHQRPITNFMLNMLIKRPEQHQLTEIARTGHTAEELFTKGGIFVSATGTGKTVQARAIFTQVGIDREENKRRPVPLWGLFVVNGRDAVMQFAGLAGDDTFRRFGPDVSITPFFEDEQDASGLIVITTRQMFVQKFRNNVFAGRPMPAVLVLDEAHRATEPLMRVTLVNHYRGPVIGFTATPAYHPEKDAEKILPYVIRRGSLLSDTKDGILNGAQLFTFMVDPRLNDAFATTLNLRDRRIFEQAAALLLDKAVVDYAADRVATGRRGIVYCNRGNESEHAQELASALSSKTFILPDGTRQQIVARAIGMFQSSKKNDKTISDYHAGKVHVLTTVDKAIESFNGEVDFIAFAARTASILRLRQMVGRGTRPSETFPITEYAEFIFPHFDSQDENYVTLWQAFELTAVQQGIIIAKETPPKHESHAVKLAIQGLRQEISLLHLEELPEQLQKFAQHAVRQMREVVIAKDIRSAVPERYIPLYAMSRALERSEVQIRSVLCDFPFYGTWEITPEGEERLIRYYPPEALEYLMVKRKVEMKPSTEFLSAFRIAQEVGCSIGFAERAIDLGTALGLPGFEPQLGKKTNAGKPVLQYGPEVLAFAEKKYAEIPPPKTGERTVNELWDELGTGRSYVQRKVHAFGIKTEPRRKSDNSLGAYLTYEDVECIRADFYAVPLAEVDEFGLQEVLQLAHVSDNPDCFTPQELVKAKRRRPIEAVGAVQNMLPLDVVVNFIQKHIPKALPGHLVPRQIILAMIDKSSPMVDQVLKNYGEPVKLKLPNTHSPAYFYPWDALFVVAESYNFKKGVPRVTYDMFPHSEEDTTPERLNFARKIQEQYLQPKALVNVPTFEEVKKQVEETIVLREKRRHAYLSQYDRAARWGITLDGGVASQVPLPVPLASPLPPKESTINREGYTSAEIAQKAGVTLEVVEDVLAKLATEYKTNRTAEECIEANGLKNWVYKGKYLDAVLMTLIGRTPERIAEIAGMPAQVVTHYLQVHHQANDKGRYDLKALLAVLAEFRRPPSRGYRLLDEVATEIGVGVPAVTETIGHYGGKVEFFYNYAGEKHAYVSSFSEKLAVNILAAPLQALPEAVSGFCNRFEIKEVHPEYSYTTIDKCLQTPAAIEKAVWLRVRDVRLADGAKALPHYPLQFFEELAALL